MHIICPSLSCATCTLQNPSWLFNAFIAIGWLMVFSASAFHMQALHCWQVGSKPLLHQRESVGMAHMLSWASVCKYLVRLDAFWACWQCRGQSNLQAHPCTLAWLAIPPAHSSPPVPFHTPGTLSINPALSPTPPALFSLHSLAWLPQIALWLPDLVVGLQWPSTTTHYASLPLLSRTDWWTLAQALL